MIQYEFLEHATSLFGDALDIDSASHRHIR
jgi:hypothetical protein